MVFFGAVENSTVGVTTVITVGVISRPTLVLVWVPQSLTGCTAGRVMPSHGVWGTLYDGEVIKEKGQE